MSEVFTFSITVYAGLKKKNHFQTWSVLTNDNKSYGTQATIITIMSVI